MSWAAPAADVRLSLAEFGHERSKSTSSIESVGLDTAPLCEKSQSDGSSWLPGDTRGRQQDDILEMERLGICEAVDSSEDEADHEGGQKLTRKLTFAETRERFRKKPLSFANVAAVSELLSSPLSGAEDSTCEEAKRKGDHRNNSNVFARQGPSSHVCATKKIFPAHRVTPPRLDFNQLVSHQDFLCDNQLQSTARKHADSLTRELSEFRPYLFLGGMEVARNCRRLKSKGITHVVNLAGATCKNCAEDKFEYLTLSPADCESEDLSCLFLPVASFINRARAEGGKVLIHCHRGISRSCAVAMAYVMLSEGKPFKRVWRELTQIRPVASPNNGFMRSLIALEKRQRHGSEFSRVVRAEVEGEGVVVMRPYHHTPFREFCEENVLVFEKSARRGIEIYRGTKVSDAKWKLVWAAVESVAKQMRNDLRRHSLSGCSSANVPIESVGQARMRQWFSC